MFRLSKYAWLALLTAVLAMFLVACGGDDDDDGVDLDDRDSTSSQDKGDDKTSDSSDDKKDDDKKDDDKKDDDEIKASGDTGSDKAYVADVCKSVRKYFDEFSTAFSDVDFTDEDYEKKLEEALTGPMKDMARDFAKAKPPKDLKEWHEDTVKAFNDTIKAIESGDENALGDEGVEFPEMPADAQTRLEKIAQDNEDCKAMADEGGSIFSE